MTTFINPKTNKKIKKDGKTYNDLIKEGYEVENNKLVNICSKSLRITSICSKLL